MSALTHRPTGRENVRHCKKTKSSRRLLPLMLAASVVLLGSAPIWKAAAQTQDIQVQIIEKEGGGAKLQQLQVDLAIILEKLTAAKAVGLPQKEQAELIKQKTIIEEQLVLQELKMVEVSFV